jgi:putative zinc finger protein
MMSCKDLKENFDDYLDGTLDERAAAQLGQHAASCDACQQLIERELRLRESLQEYGAISAPQPDAGYFDRALIAAEHQGLKQQHRRSWVTGFGSAVAAGLAIWLLSGILIETPTPVQPGAGIPMVTMALEEPHTVNLVFSSTLALDDATLTILLPDGVELVGFAGQREVTWMTSLKEGKNLLPLRLIATIPTAGELLATLRHGDDDRTFRLRVNVS